MCYTNIMKTFLWSLLLTLFFAISALSVEAKVLPRFSSKSTGLTYVSGIGVSARLRADRRALNVYFSNLQKANSVMYTLIYETNGKQEGASGTIDISSSNASRELLFGTCSSGDCTYHQNITNMKLEVLTELTNGKKTMKRFKVRI